ncbi:hypothetical protein S40293_00244 [Stachybotrys chartarum IBT 40293]|nr:hypothetical protein S40293_00244 [Stachybotrys chartarum IBT 40293]
MALVDYDSSSSGASSPAADKSSDVEDQPKADGQPSAKRRKTVKSIGSGADSGMPPLPSTFHDLYASTVRQSNVDDPSLHKGRKRQTPHIVGNWPTHLYIEWHPTVAQHDVLVALLRAVEAVVGDEGKLESFLSSDLGAPLPLHISLSRPMSLTTADKDRFLERITTSMSASAQGTFSVSPRGLAWFRSPDSNRNFLILRVESSSGSRATRHGTSTNPELMTLLTRCNTEATMFQQQPLYQRNKKEQADSAFHISIAWTFDLPSDQTALEALQVFHYKKFREVQDWKIVVSSVKAKIGNVVNNIKLTGLGKGSSSFEEPDAVLR